MSDEPADQIGTILASRPVPCGSAEVEMHTALCRDHIPLYLVAAKSLLVHWEEPRLVVHDDGTLDAASVDLLRHHLPGVRVIARAEADRAVSAALGADSPLLTVRGYGPRLMQIVDYFVLADTDRVIALDSDIVIMSRPDAVIEWAHGDSDRQPALLYSPEGPWTPQGVHWISEYQPGSRYLPNICCGFAATYRPLFWDPATIVAAASNMPIEILRRGRYISQMSYSLLGGRLDGPTAARSLDDDYRSGRRDGIGYRPAVMYHYFGSERETTEANVDGEWDCITEILGKVAA